MILFSENISRDARKKSAIGLGRKELGRLRSATSRGGAACKPPEQSKPATAPV
ncbi:MAG: hypothetical protein GY847_25105 [Proteobacteria bacterium]|nr:hypothetical protein [Pseudomonadota bacterium]